MARDKHADKRGADSCTKFLYNSNKILVNVRGLANGGYKSFLIFLLRHLLVLASNWIHLYVVLATNLLSSYRRAKKSYSSPSSTDRLIIILINHSHRLRRAYTKPIPTQWPHTSGGAYTFHLQSHINGMAIHHRRKSIYILYIKHDLYKIAIHYLRRKIELYYTVMIEPNLRISDI